MQMEQSFLTTFAYAKINLALAIHGIREDGYHELQSVMQSIALHDIVRVRRRGEKVVCRCGALSGSGNLAYKAAVLFQEQCGQFGGIEIEIEKHIPVQAGLAGGSTDAAATLRLLNQLYEEPLDQGSTSQAGGEMWCRCRFLSAWRNDVGDWTGRTAGIIACSSKAGSCLNQTIGWCEHEGGLSPI